MSVTSFKPIIWVANLQHKLRKSLVSENFVNHDYQGVVMGAGSVKINTIGRIAVKDYDGSPITYDKLSTTDQTLLIDKQKIFAFAVPDVDLAQVANGGQMMIDAMDEAAYSVAENRDACTFETIVEGAGVEISTIAEPISVLTSEDTKDVIIRLNTEADLANVPKEGRRLAVGPKFYNKLVSDKYLGLAQPTANDTLKAGYMGKLYGIEIYETNNLPKNGDNEYVVLTHPKFTTSASQIEKIEALRDPDEFQDLIRGLDVFGTKVTRPEGVIKGVVKYN